MAFIFFAGFIIFQRIVELKIAKRNEKWMKNKGAIELGQGHYPAMVMIHTAFFISYISEVILLDKTLTRYWPWLMMVFLLTQAMRVWSLMSLGRFWNTKIIILPGANVVKKGPYRMIKHPNYLIVTVELIIIPLMFNAFFTFVLFTILNILILSIRIPAEEKALKQLTEYEATFTQQGRFVPNLLKKYDN
ncbi:isoprenylcysteine carboxylmethyltransferase family protein [Bacillus sp. REN3]|uniref:isoprenylcysteine carboxyl methyltransferase family protein n=1 Tax=Bacillus sp. REN3 TaxID=2802440 RepID=UPI001AEE57F8|nr:isoprenylcysteine carboxylmethyltransferase family protein [Bacillus sp. REN3]